MKMTKDEKRIKDYCAFMYNPENIGNCAECPENRDFVQGSGYICGPCGQQNCYVDVHCNPEKYERF